jgi:branched-chain amino acid transport system substrate-binding protein
MNRTCLVALAVFACVFVEPLSGSAVFAAPDSLKIGAVVSLTGPDSNLGNQAKAGYEMAVEEFNKQGGVYVKELGKKVLLEVKVLDMESSSEKAVARMETLYSSEKVHAYVGTTFMAAGCGVAEKNRVPTIVIASAQQAIHERGLKYWFAAAGKNPDIAKVMMAILNTLPKENKPKTIAVFEEQTDFGLEISGLVQKEAAAHGYQVPVVKKYSMLTKDMSPLIQAAKAANAEVLFAPPIMPDGMTMIRQMKQLDYSPKGIVLIRGADDLSWAKALRADADYVMLSGGWHHAVSYPGVAELNGKYQAKFGRPADMQTGPAYASIQIIADAVQRAGSLDTAKIRDAIAASDMMTVAGPIKFRPNGTLVDPCDASIQWQNGKQELIWPVKFRTKELIYPMPSWSKR